MWLTASDICVMLSVQHKTKSLSIALTTPYLDRLAPNVTLLETCISPHIPTRPAHTTMLTGKDALAHQIITQDGSLIQI